MSRETYSQPVEFLLPVGCLLFAPISSRFAGKIGKNKNRQQTSYYLL